MQAIYFSILIIYLHMFHTFPHSITVLELTLPGILVCKTDANKSNIFIKFQPLNSRRILKGDTTVSDTSIMTLTGVHVLTAGAPPLTEAQFHATPAGCPQPITRLVSQQKCLACNRFIQ
jgi:hypothetical protein